jgi:hypothetical protein
MKPYSFSRFAGYEVLKATERVLLLSFFIPLSASDFKPGTQAVVTAPIVDITSRPLSHFGKQVPGYYEFAYAPHAGYLSCLRLHQLKFNEVVTINKVVSEHEVECTVPGLFYGSGLRTQKSNFWMLKRDLVPLNQLPAHVAKSIPLKAERPSIVLIMPWHHKSGNKTYSVGTRFVRSLKGDTTAAYKVKIMDRKNLVVKEALVPKKYAIKVVSKRNFNVSRKMFLSVLKRWAHLEKGFIPYVYGGCSFSKAVFERQFMHQQGKFCGQRVSYWNRAQIKEKPLSGFDCSNMILCAAKIAGLPYHYKNSQALVNKLRELRPDEKLENGDLIWYVGHVIVVSDVTKNLCIESVGYDSGHGCVHEIFLEKIFKGVKDFNQLLKAYREKRILKRLNKKGEPYKTVYRIKILKMNSIIQKK